MLDYGVRCSLQNGGSDMLICVFAVLVWGGALLLTNGNADPVWIGWIVFSYYVFEIIHLKRKERRYPGVLESRRYAGQYRQFKRLDAMIAVATAVLIGLNYADLLLEWAFVTSAAFIVAIGSMFIHTMGIMLNIDDSEDLIWDPPKLPSSQS